MTEYSGSERDRTADAVRTVLVHSHLPKLAAADLIAWDRADETVGATTHPALADPRFERLLELEIDGLDAVLSHLASDSRRVLLTVLREARASMTRRDVAVELLRSADTDLEPDSDAIEDVVASLYHVHLPALAADDLVELDPRTDRVAYADHPAAEDVFAVLYESEDRIVDSYDGFLTGLGEAYENLRSDSTAEAGWPDFWREPSYE
ncbi:hypothetical protein GCM10028856_26540 [Halopiger thermotolerans]